MTAYYHHNDAISKPYHFGNKASAKLQTFERLQRLSNLQKPNTARWQPKKCKKQANFNLKTVNTTSRACTEQVEKVQQDLVAIFLEQNRVNVFIENLECNQKKAAQDIEDLFDDITRLLQTQKRAALYNVVRYTNEKKNDLTKYLQTLQERSKQMNDYINELIFWDKNKPTMDLLEIPFYSNSFQLNQAMYNYDISVTLGLHNDKNNNFSRDIQQMLNQKLAIVEQGSIQVESIIVQRSSSNNPMPLVYWRTDGITIDDRSSFELEVSSCNENADSAKWCVRSRSPGANTSGIVIINDEKETKLKWGDTNNVRIRFCRFGVSYTPFSENYLICFTDNFTDSYIIKAKEIKALESLLPRNYSKVQLLYRGSDHNFCAKAFRDRCNGKAPTIVIVLSEFNYVFGGYTNVKWHGRKTEQVLTFDPDSFLYSLQRNHNTCQKFPIKKEYASKTISGGRGGPKFGEDDLVISDKCNINTESCCKQKNYDGPSDGISLAEASNFKVKEIEVYQLLE